MGSRILIILVILLAQQMSSIAQRSGNSALYDTGIRLRPSGLFVGGGMSNLFVHNSERSDIHNFGLQTSYLTTYKREVKPATAIRMGYFIAPQTGFIRTIELSVAFKKRRGYESAHGVRQEGTDVTYEQHVYANGQFVHHSVNFSLNPTIVWGLGRTAFFHHGPGIDFEMVLRRKESYSNSILPVNVDESGDEQYTSVTYGAGIGFKTKGRSLVLIGARMPIAHPFGGDSPTATRTILNSTYRPYSIFLTYQWLKKRSNLGCGGAKRSKRGGRFPRARRTKGAKPW